MRLLHAKQVAEMLLLGSKGRVYELARRKIIPSVRIGRLVRFDEDALCAWIMRGGTPLPEDADKAPPTTVANVPPTSIKRGLET